MPDEDDTPKAEVARERRARPPAATEEAAAPEPLPDRAELEQLRARLIAKYRGRR
jgi:hypothetical protein